MGGERLYAVNMVTAAGAQRRRWRFQAVIGIGGLIVALLGRVLGGRWWAFVSPCLLAVFAIVMLVRGRPGERLLVVSVCLAILGVLGFALMIGVLTT